MCYKFPAIQKNGGSRQQNINRALKDDYCNGMSCKSNGRAVAGASDAGEELSFFTFRIFVTPL